MCHIPCRLLQLSFGKSVDSAPVIQDVNLVPDRNARRQEIADGPHNSCGFEVAARIIGAAYDEQARIVTLNLHDEIVQVLEIVVVRDSSTRSSRTACVR